MSGGYQTLYRKYRSQSFADLVGQEAASRALQGAIASDHVAHAYLFSGSRGTGKTSTARLLAKAINCFSRAPGAAEPCNQCESCVQVNAGAALDLIEIDAASNRGIDEIRELREKVHLAPALGKRKIYIIDEAHMLTEPAFNALLKTLEEPPDHVVFILCTTDAQKIPLTVLGRCQQFVFRRFSEQEIVGRLQYIAEREGIAVEPFALGLVARTALGSMRDAVGLFDQLIPLAHGRVITLPMARELLGAADPEYLARLLDLVLSGRPREALAALEELYQGGAELRQVVRGLMELCRDRLVTAIENNDQPARARLAAALDALLHLDGEVRRHGEPRFLVEATLVRLAVEHGSQAAAQAAPDSPVPEMTAPVTPEAFPAIAAASAAPPAGVTGTLLEGWRDATKELKPIVRAVCLAAQPELDGSRLVLWFDYENQKKIARENGGEIVSWAARWLGRSLTLDLRVREPNMLATPARPPAPEEHPVVEAAVRRLEGRVTRVREI